MPGAERVSDKEAKGLISNYDSTDRRLQELKKLLETLNEILDIVRKLLLIPKDVSDGLTDLDNLLVLVSELLTAVQIIPPITAEAAALQKVVDGVQKVVHPIRKTANQIENQVKPYRKYVEDIQKFFNKIIPLVDALDQFIQSEHGLIKKTNASNNALPDSRYKRDQMKSLEGFSDGLNKDMIDPMKIINEILKAMDFIKEALDIITKACKTLSELMKPVLRVTEVLDDLTKPLKALDKALDQKVHFLFFSISIRDLFTTLEDIPFIGKLTDLAMAILKPILRALHLDVDLSLPGVGNITGGMRKVIGNLDSIKKTMTGSQPNMISMFERKSLENMINRHDV